MVTSHVRFVSLDAMIDGKRSGRRSSRRWTSKVPGVAHGALAMATPGDTSMATLAEVERVMKGGTARVSR